MSKLLRAPEFTLVASAVIVAGVTAVAYIWLGFLGVALVGVLLLFMAVQSELQKNGARRLFIAERLSRTAQIARDAEGEGMARFWRLAAMLGGVLAVIGVAGFAILQLPS